MNLTLIAAMERHSGIGITDALPWHCPEDMAYFRTTTTGYPVIMGRKTFAAIGKPLPNRRNIVLTRSPEFFVQPGVQYPAVELATLNTLPALVGEEPAFIIGGGDVYSATIDKAQRLLITEVHKSFQCDTFFPPIDSSKWYESKRECHRSSQGFDYAFVEYLRR